MQELTKDAVIKRLRKLSQPVTLFGETDEERIARMKKCEAEMVVDDTDEYDVVGKNMLRVSVRSYARTSRIPPSPSRNSLHTAAWISLRARQLLTRPFSTQVIQEEEEELRKKQLLEGGPAAARRGETGPSDRGQAAPPDPVKAAFEKAAQKLRDQKSDELNPDDKVLYWMDRWCEVSSRIGSCASASTHSCVRFDSHGVVATSGGEPRLAAPAGMERGP